MQNPGLTKSFIAGAAIAQYQLVKFGADEKTVIPATAATDVIFGIATLSAAAGGRVDIVLDDIYEATYGGTVNIGDFLTSDTSGHAVVATSGNRTIGMAMVAGVSGDIGTVLINQSKI